MKSTILAAALCALPLFVDAGSLSGNNGHSKSLLSFRRHDSHKRHAALTPSQKLTMVKRRRSLYARKTPGEGDSTEQPDNIAEGTYTKEQGCAIWHSVGEGEVCLGLIDKSSKDFDLAKFIKFNPSVGKDCQDLRVGLSYCVDTVASATASAAKSGPSPAIKAQEASKQLTAEEPAAPQADADVDAEDDCEEEDDEAQYDDEEDCEEEDDAESYSQDTAQPVQAEAAQNNGGDQSNNGQEQQQAPAPAPSPAQNTEPAPQPKEAAKKQPEQPQQQQPEQQQTTSTWEAPKETSTWEAPQETSTWEAPKETTPTSTWTAPEETKQPEPEQPQQPDNGGGFEYNAQPATYYYQNGNAGSCGDYNNDGAMIVAIKSNIMGSDLCGKTVKLRNSSTGKVVMAKVADTCPTCTGSTGIDLSEGLFKALEPNANLGTGMFNVDYSIY